MKSKQLILIVILFIFAEFTLSTKPLKKPNKKKQDATDLCTNGIVCDGTTCSLTINEVAYTLTYSGDVAVPATADNLVCIAADTEQVYVVDKENSLLHSLNISTEGAAFGEPSSSIGSLCTNTVYVFTNFVYKADPNQFYYASATALELANLVCFTFNDQTTVIDISSNTAISTTTQSNTDYEVVSCNSKTMIKYQDDYYVIVSDALTAIKTLLTNTELSVSSYYCENNYALVQQKGETEDLTTFLSTEDWKPVTLLSLTNSCEDTNVVVVDLTDSSQDILIESGDKFTYLTATKGLERYLCRVDDTNAMTQLFAKEGEDWSIYNLDGTNTSKFTKSCSNFIYITTNDADEYFDVSGTSLVVSTKEDFEACESSSSTTSTEESSATTDTTTISTEETTETSSTDAAATTTTDAETTTTTDAEATTTTDAAATTDSTATTSSDAAATTSSTESSATSTETTETSSTAESTSNTETQTNSTNSTLADNSTETQTSNETEATSTNSTETESISSSTTSDSTTEGESSSETSTNTSTTSTAETQDISKAFTSDNTESVSSLQSFSYGDAVYTQFSLDQIPSRKQAASNMTAVILINGPATETQKVFSVGSTKLLSPARKVKIAEGAISDLLDNEIILLFENGKIYWNFNLYNYNDDLVGIYFPNQLYCKNYNVASLEKYENAYRVKLNDGDYLFGYQVSWETEPETYDDPLEIVIFVKS